MALTAYTLILMSYRSVLFALLLTASTASAQTPAAPAPRRATATRGPPRRAAGHDDVPGRYRALVRPDGRNPAGAQMVAERLSRELRRQPGIHRRVELAGDVRVRRARSRGAVRIVRRGEPHRSRRAAAVPRVRSSPQLGRTGAAASCRRTRSRARHGAATTSATCGSAPRSTCASQWRQQPAAFAIRAHGEGADRRHGQRREHGQGGLRGRRDRRAANGTDASSCRDTAGSSSAARPTRSKRPTAFRWGVGAAFPSRKGLRVHRRDRRRGLHEGRAEDEGRCSSARTVRSRRRASSTR